MSHPEVVIVGGGVVGLTTALKLAERGTSVTILDSQAVGREASWAGAGMLPPGNLTNAKTPEARLRAYSHSLWPQFAESLTESTGIDIGYHVCGAIEICSSQTPETLEHLAEQWSREGVRANLISASALREHVSGIADGFTGAVFLPDFGQVRNPRHLSALKSACVKLGVEILEHSLISDVRRQSDRMTEIRIGERTLQFDRICFAAGAWTANLLQSLGFSMPVKPVRGQIVQLKLPSPPFSSVIEMGKKYLVPRRDGFVLIGSTEEDAGFEKKTTTEGNSELMTFATSVVPSLASAEVVNHWAGLRPGSPDELPLLGLLPGFSNAYIGAGHFRAGLQMSPATGTILADLMLDQVPAISMDGLQPDRFVSKYPAL